MQSSPAMLLNEYVPFNAVVVTVATVCARQRILSAKSCVALVRMGLSA
jgi:hypothetical protein